MLPFSIEAAVLCDEVRQEVNGKYILIGTYNGIVVVADFPAQLQVSWWIQIFPKETGKFDLDIQLIKDGKDTIIKADLGYEVHAKDWAAMVLPKIPVPIHGPGKMQLQMKLKSEAKWSIVQTFEVRKGSVTVTIPPAQQRVA
jgi:hypothetical protein